MTKYKPSKKIDNVDNMLIRLDGVPCILPIFASASMLVWDNSAIKARIPTTQKAQLLPVIYALQIMNNVIHPVLDINSQIRGRIMRNMVYTTQFLRGGRQ